MTNNQLLSNYYSLHRDELVSFVAVRCADAVEAEDIVQDIFLHLLRGRQLITPQTLPALLHTMARHAVSDYYRRRHVFDQYEHYIKTSAISHQTSAISHQTSPAESVYSARQIMEHMERSLARLPKACCDIYRLHIYGGLQVSDIARELSLPYKQVENRLGQARRAVRQHLRPCV